MKQRANACARKIKNKTKKLAAAAAMVSAAAFTTVLSIPHMPPVPTMASSPPDLGASAGEADSGDFSFVLPKMSNTFSGVHLDISDVSSAHFSGADEGCLRCTKRRRAIDSGKDTLADTPGNENSDINLDSHFELLDFLNGSSFGLPDFINGSGDYLKENLESGEIPNSCSFRMVSKVEDKCTTPMEEQVDNYFYQEEDFFTESPASLTLSDGAHMQDMRI